MNTKTQKEKKEEKPIEEKLKDFVDVLMSPNFDAEFLIDVSEHLWNVARALEKEGVEDTIIAEVLSRIYHIYHVVEISKDLSVLLSGGTHFESQVTKNSEITIKILRICIGSEDEEVFGEALLKYAKELIADVLDITKDMIEKVGRCVWVSIPLSAFVE